MAQIGTNLNLKKLENVANVGNTTHLRFKNVTDNIRTENVYIWLYVSQDSTELHRLSNVCICMYIVYILYSSVHHSFKLFQVLSITIFKFKCMFQCNVCHSKFYISIFLI